MNVHAPSEPMTPEGLEAALRAIGPVRYHDLHPFHGLLHDGNLNKGQVQAWALNRFVYQSAIPRKDASLIARCEDTPVKLMTPDELEAELRDIGAKRYHRLHPFHGLLHGGKCTKGQVQAWALNRYYYQAMIPIKDASLIARCEDSAVRREWRSRLHDHDGEHEGDGGIARWLKLTDGLGLDRDYVTSLRGLLPGTKFAVEAYVHFVAEKTLLEAIASALNTRSGASSTQPPCASL